MTDPALAQHRPRAARHRRIVAPRRGGFSRQQLVLGHLMARAFQDDPQMVFTEPDPARRRAVLPWLFARNVAACAADVVDEIRGQGGAIWIRPPRSELDARRILRGGLWRVPAHLGPAATARLLATLHGATGAPAEACDLNALYLYILAVDPSQQGRGVAGRLLRPRLAEADAAGRRVRLETFNPDNVAVYEHFGFRVVDSRGPLGIPRQWLMVREPGTTLGR